MRPAKKSVAGRVAQKHPNRLVDFVGVCCYGADIADMSAVANICLELSRLNPQAYIQSIRRKISPRALIELVLVRQRVLLMPPHAHDTTNMDQTPIRGSTSIHLLAPGEKMRATFNTAITLAAETNKLKPLVIFKGKPGGRIVKNLSYPPTLMMNFGRSRRTLGAMIIVRQYGPDPYYIQPIIILDVKVHLTSAGVCCDCYDPSYRSKKFQ
eukprot:scaffold12928_cov64-Cyclotella_meneghiniana.AAC.6